MHVHMPEYSDKYDDVTLVAISRWDSVCTSRLRLSPMFKLVSLSLLAMSVKDPVTPGRSRLPADKQ